MEGSREEAERRQLLKGIEDASTHARVILYWLMGTIAYVLLAVLSSSEKELSLKLPFFETQVSRTTFFVLAPLILLLIYAYLQIHMRELYSRLEQVVAFYRERYARRLDSSHLFFPWIATIAYRERLDASNVASAQEILGNTSFEDRVLAGSNWLAQVSIRVATNVLLTYLCPIVLFLLWIGAVTDQPWSGVTACSAFLLSTLLSRLSASKQCPLWLIMCFVLVAPSLFLVSLTYEPSIRDHPALESAILLLTGSAELYGIRLWYLVAGLVIAMFAVPLLPSILWVILRLFLRPTLKLRLRLIELIDDLTARWGTWGVVIFYLSWMFFEVVLKHRGLVGIPKRVRGSLLRGRTVYLTNLSHVCFEGANLRDTHFYFTDLEGASCAAADLHGATLTGTTLKRTTFENANLTYVNITGIVVLAVSFRGADMQYARISSRTMDDVDFTAANLQGANLDVAMLRDVSLVDADLTAAELPVASVHTYINTRYSAKTKFPKGFKIAAKSGLRKVP